MNRVLRKLLIPLVSVSFVLAGCDVGDRDRTIGVTEDDPAMNAAIAEARATLGEFVARMENPEPGDSDFAIKVAITDPNGTEHFWANNVEVIGPGFTATINNDPNIVRSVRLGQRVRARRDDVSDWLYLSNGRMVGNRTLRVLLTKMSPEEAAAVKRQVGWK
ncbi:MAG: DUF2314 domain-containing protein [Candidatus Hydrogenedentes bacterium]|nr:DUF2314 domain-containing protein [Candidatus Hydrogenedentota bacterium]